MLSSIVQKFLQQIAAGAQRLGVTELVIGIKDPRTGDIVVTASKQAVSDENMRQHIAAKFSLSDGGYDTAWPT